MGETDLAAKVIGAIAEKRRLSADQISLESSFEDLGIDSLDGFDLLCDLEEELGITIPDDAARQMTSVGKVVELIQPLVSSAPSEPQGAES